MLTTSQTLLGYEITEVLGIIEGIAEGSFPILSIEHLSIEKGGGLASLVEKAKDGITRGAYSLGATAVVGFRYEIVGRHTEKSVLAYGDCGQMQKAIALICTCQVSEQLLASLIKSGILPLT